MPPNIQAALLLKFNPAPAPATPEKVDLNARSQHLWSVYARKPDSLREIAKYRHGLLRHVEYLVANGTRRLRAIAEISRQANEPVANIRRWAGLIKDLPRSDWEPALAPKWIGRTATAECSIEAWDYFKADYLRPERPGAEAVYRRLERAGKAKAWIIPACVTLLRKIEREFSPMAIAIARYGIDEAQRMYPAQERDKSALQAMQVVNADGHKLDIFCDFGDGRVGRPIVSIWQDVYSGKMLGWRIGEVECADTIRLAFADTVERYGIPLEAVLDNGRGFASKWVTGGQATRNRFTIKAEEPEGILTAFGIRVHWATPYHGQAKPIERGFRDVCEDVAKHPDFAGAWTGNSPANKPENYGLKAIPIAEVRRVFAEQLLLHNAREGRRSPICNGRSFDHVFAESYARAMPRKASPEQQRLLLLAAEGVTVDRTDNSIRLHGNRYWIDAKPLADLAGRKVVVRFDPQDLRRPVHVYRLDGAFVATLEMIERTGFLDVEAGQAHARDRKRHIKAQKLQLELERRMDIRTVAALLPAAQPEQPLPEPKVVTLLPARALGAAPARKRMTQEQVDDAFSAGVELLEK
ncbi:MAG: transposase domain-containing protein, partial [Hypericibacter sp.]